MAGDLSVPGGALDQALTAAAQRAPHALYVTGEDQLRLTVLNALAGVTVTVRGRFEDLEGRVTPFSTALVPASDRTASSVTVRLGTGWLLSANAIVTVGAPLTGQTFALLSLIRGEGTAAIELATLATAYITTAQRAGYPGSPIVSSLDGGGAIRSIAGATPAAGAEISETVPTGARWEVLAFKTDFLASGVAGNRIPHLLFDDGANVYASLGLNNTITAGQLRTMTWAQGLPTVFVATSDRAMSSLPTNNRLAAGHRIRTASSLDAADTYLAVRYVVREWLEAA